MILNKSSLLLIALFIIIPFSLLAQDNSFNCFSILVGKNASSDGSVFLAHNEDDGGDRVVNWYKVPHEVYDNLPNSIRLKRGAIVEQVKETYSYLWLELPELEFSDTYMNEYGLTITSNGCSSREDKPVLTDGGIGYWLRRLMIERAITAKEAVKIGGALIEKYGYTSSGRTYLIAGSYETWMLAVVNGKHWVAQRVPHDHVAIIPNNFTIGVINLNNKSNFLGSADIIDYAIERGWYAPEIDGQFNFQKAYSDPKKLENKSNIARHWVILNALSRDQYALDDVFPFSFKPEDKVQLTTLFTLLRNHYEGTSLDITNTYEYGNPHQQETMTVCSNSNQYGFVAQLRSWLSVEIGNVLWLAPRRPCNQAFIPVYSGVLSVPDNLAITDYKMALKNHFDGIPDYPQYENHIHRLFNEKSKFIDQNYKKRILDSKEKLEKIEKKLLSNQDKFENKMQQQLLNNTDIARKKITNYSIDQLEKLVKEAKE